MPIIKSSIKQMKQNRTRRARLLPFNSRMKTMIKKVLELAKEGKKDEAKQILPIAFKTIDTAVKKQILHRKTADRRKSLLSRAVASVSK